MLCSNASQSDGASGEPKGSRFEVEGNEVDEDQSEEEKEAEEEEEEDEKDWARRSGN